MGRSLHQLWLFLPRRTSDITKGHSEQNAITYVPGQIYSTQYALYLPYSQAHLNVYFDAKEVLHSLLTCLMLNKDDNYMFHDTQHPDTCNPFTKHDGGILSDVNTGCSYLKTYDKLIKDPSKDMLLPCILAIDKTHCDSGGSRLQMEPLTTTYGLLRHNICKDPASVRILGYINLSPQIRLSAHCQSSIPPQRGTSSKMEWSDCCCLFIEQVSPSASLYFGNVRHPISPGSWFHCSFNRYNVVTR
jgi:hypothetical protein